MFDSEDDWDENDLTEVPVNNGNPALISNSFSIIF
jgi:hypothetical protein